jgi:hypothetical protein
MPPRHGWDAYKCFTKDAKGIYKILEEEAADQRYSKALFEDGWEWFIQHQKQLRKVDQAIAAVFA